MRRRVPFQRVARRGTLAIAVATLTLATGVVRPSPPPPPASAGLARAASDLTRLADAFRVHGVDTGRWPGPGSGVEAIPAGPFALNDLSPLSGDARGEPGWAGPYLDPATLSDPGGRGLDPWGHAYLAFAPPQGPGRGSGALWLYCAGPDGRLDSGLDDARSGRTRGDDLAVLVTRLP